MAILYKDGDRITGNEKVIYTEEYAGATLHFISENCFWISTEGLELKQDNLEAINAFSKSGYREEKVLKDWPKAQTLPKRVYFLKRDSSTSCDQLENIYNSIANRIELNAQAAINVKYFGLHKKYLNGVQRKDLKGKIFHSMFTSWIEGGGVHVDWDVSGYWGSDVWFPVSI